MVKFYIFQFKRIVDKSLVYAVPELAIALGVAPATAYRAVIPGECLNLRLRDGGRWTRTLGITNGTS